MNILSTNNSYLRPSIYNSSGGGGNSGENGYLNFASGDFSDLNSPFNINNGEFYLLSVIAQSTKVTDFAVAIEQNNLGAGDSKQAYLGLYNQVNGINTLETYAQGTIDSSQPSYSFFNLSLGAEYEITHPALNQRLFFGINDAIGGGSLRLYRTRASSVNDWRIAGRYTKASGAPLASVTNPQLSNNNTQPFIVAYHNTQKIDLSDWLPHECSYQGIDYGIRSEDPTILLTNDFYVGDYYTDNTTFERKTYNGVNWV